MCISREDPGLLLGMTYTSVTSLDREEVGGALGNPGCRSPFSFLPNVSYSKRFYRGLDSRPLSYRQIMSLGENLGSATYLG